MAGSRLDSAKDTAVGLVAKLDESDRISVLAFNAHPRFVLRRALDRTLIIQAIRGLTTSRGTRIDLALHAIEDELVDAMGNSTHRSIVLLMSDGEHDGPAADVQLVAARVRELSSRVYVVGLGEQIDANLLSDIASDGGFYWARDAAGLADVVARLEDHTRCSGEFRR
jgi:uncharacterized protein YegL